MIFRAMARSLFFFLLSLTLLCSHASAQPIEDGCVGELSVLSNLDLENAIRLAICNDELAKQGLYTIQQRSATLGIAKSKTYPTVDGVVDRRSVNSRYVYSDGHAGSTTSGNPSSASVRFAWTIFDFGYNQEMVKGAKGLLSSAQFYQQQRIVDLIESTATAYYAAYMNYQELKVYESYSVEAQSNFRRAEAKFSAGGGIKSDYLMLKTIYERSRLQLRQIQSESLVRRGELARILGARADTPIRLTSSLSTVAKLDLISISSLIDISLRASPKISALKAEYESAQSEVRAAKVDGYPKVSLVGSLGYDDDVVGQGSLHSVGSRSVGIQIEVPLFDGFARHSQLRYKIAAANSKLSQTEDAKADIALKVWRDYQNQISAADEVQMSAQIESVAKDAYATALSKYEVGALSISAITDAQKEFLSARLQKIQADYKFLVSNIGLQGSLGALAVYFP